MLAFLIVNPLMYFFVSPFAAGWLLLAEFIFTLGMALKCHPLLPVLVLEAVLIGMASAEQIKTELANNLEVLLLLIFMVAGIFFMKQLLFVFTRLLLSIKSKVRLGVTFCLAAAFLSAFLDALAVVSSVAVSFYEIYHRVASAPHYQQHPLAQHETLEQFRAFLRSLMMQAGVGTALGGVMTMVGEPQNLIIAHAAGWDFVQFFLRMAPVTVPVLLCGIMTSIAVEKFKWFSYGTTLPASVRQLLEESEQQQAAQRSRQETLKLWIQAAIGIWLIVALAFHLAEVVLIGLSVIIMETALCGITDEHTIGQAFTEALPLTALLTVFFAIVAVIIEQQLFAPHWWISYSAQSPMHNSNGSTSSTVCCHPFLITSSSGRFISMKRVMPLIVARLTRRSLSYWRWPSIPALICLLSPPRTARPLSCFC